MTSTTGGTAAIRRGVLVALAGVAVVTAGCGSGEDAAVVPAAAAATVPDHGHDLAGSSAAAELRQDLRKLWEDHVTWTRLFIVSAVAGLPDADAAAGRLLQNQADIGAAIAEYYGDDAGAELTELLRGHILVAADLLAAAAAGDAAAVEQQQAAWDANAVEIAELLAAANPAWPVDTLTEMMREHLDGTLAEATARLTGDWDADIAAYDRVHDHILVMSDALAAGIVDQFPDRFED
jgi:hypothetical protein